MSGKIEALKAKKNEWLTWRDLWPADVQTKAKGWTEQLRPGLHLLVDETGEEGRHWAALLAGHVMPGRGRVQCNGLCSQVDSAAYQNQVYWQKPRDSMRFREITAQQWVGEMVQRWPHWDGVAWRRHCQGFDLTGHMDKPLWHLSTGCLRKLGIAAALASQATLTVIEEPVAALDAQSIEYLRQALEALSETLALPTSAPRWVMVVHWDLLPPVTWHEVLAAPSLALVELQQAFDEDAQNSSLPVQQSLI